MFKFDFDVDEDPEIDSALLVGGSSNIESQTNKNGPDEKSSEDVAVAPFVEHSLDELLNTLTSTGFSFSPLHIPSHAPHADPVPVILPRRDLFDARFQLIASSSQENSEAEESEERVDVDSDLKFVEAPSDLIPGVYEGGLKTWECSVDLAAYLRDRLPSESVVGKRVLELGCGTAVPSMYLLRQAFSRMSPIPNQSTSETAVHLQDYNELVFRLAVLPNIILTWYMSPASASFRERLTNTSTNSTATSEDDETYPPADPSQPGDLPITPELLTAFRKSLTEHNIDLRFFSGSWEAFTFDGERGKRKYDLVLTSETIYRIDSVPSLLNLMWQASTGGGSNSLEDLTSELKISAEDDEPSQHEREGPEANGLCIVAAKLVYFGVGGGVSEFVDAVENVRHSDEGASARPAGSVRTVWKKDEGVKRVIMEVKW